MARLPQGPDKQVTAPKRLKPWLTRNAKIAAMLSTTPATDRRLAATRDQLNGASAAHCTIAASFPNATVPPMPPGKGTPNVASVSMPFTQ